MLAWIQSHLISEVGIALCLFALGWLTSKAPAALADKVEKALSKLFVAGDAADDELLCGFIRWAEKKYGAGTGAQKAAAVTDKIIALLPAQYRMFCVGRVREKALGFFQAAFDRLEAVALKEVQKHQPPASPAV